MKGTFAVGLIVINQFGVLHRISGLISKRGYNITSITVGETEDSVYSRMTIVIRGGHYIRDQVVKQLKKLHDVKVVYLFEKETMTVEYCLLKMQYKPLKEQKLLKHINQFEGKVIDRGEAFLTAEVTGATEQIDDFIEKSIKFGILELCRSGAVSMSKGEKSVLSLNNIKKGDYYYVKNVL